MAVFCLSIGLSVIIKKRPLIFPAKLIFAFIVLGFSPKFIFSFKLLSRDEPYLLQFFFILSSFILVCILTYCWFQMQGYTIIGVTDESFKNAIHHSLEKYNLPFEEQLSFFKLTSLNASLQITMHSEIGVGLTKLKDSKDQKLLKSLTSEMNEYFEKSSDAPNEFTPTFYIIAGISLIILTILLFLITL